MEPSMRIRLKRLCRNAFLIAPPPSPQRALLFEGLSNFCLALLGGRIYNGGNGGLRRDAELVCQHDNQPPKRH